MSSFWCTGCKTTTDLMLDEFEEFPQCGSCGNSIPPEPKDRTPLANFVDGPLMAQLAVELDKKALSTTTEGIEDLARKLCACYPYRAQALAAAIMGPERRDYPPDGVNPFAHGEPPESHGERRG